MKIDANIGIIGGNGWLGQAIAQALIASETVQPQQLMLSSRSGRRGDSDIAGAHWTQDNQELVDGCDIVLLSVRPEQFPAVSVDASSKLVISVMAGIAAQTIAQHTATPRVARSIPNAAAAIRRSFTPWFATAAVTAADRQRVQTLFAACGEAAEVAQEAHIDYCVAMTGPGAAFPALLAEALVADAVKQGLPREFAQRAAQSVVADASQLFAAGLADTGGIVQAMIDYGGATTEALQTTLDHGFNEAVAAGVQAAVAHSLPTKG